MRILKQRGMPYDLRLFEILKNRSPFSPNHERHHLALAKGLKGELLFDKMLDKVEGEFVEIRDFRCVWNNSYFQLDTVLLFSESIMFYEIKNMAGDYSYEDEKLVKLPSLEVKNPFHQIEKSSLLFRKLLTHLGYTGTLHANLLFVDPTFLMYQAPRNKNIIFPNQLPKHLETLSTSSSPLELHTQEFASKLLTYHTTKNNFPKPIDYTYQGIKKGISCNACQSLRVIVEGRSVLCKRCKQYERTSDAVLRMTKDLQFLFPEMRITTPLVFEWCGELVSEKHISRVLKENLVRYSEHRWTYYV